MSELPQFSFHFVKGKSMHVGGYCRHVIHLMTEKNWIKPHIEQNSGLNLTRDSVQEVLMYMQQLHG